MPTTARCPFCETLMAVPRELLGQEVECPGCAKTFISNEEPRRRRRRDDEYEDDDEDKIDRRLRLDDRRLDAFAKLRPPAIALIVVGALQFLVMGVLSAIFGTTAFGGGGGGGFGAAPIAGYFIIEFVRSTLAVVGACQMLNARSYGWGVTASILIIIPSCCHVTPWTFWLWFLNLAFGIWALVIINDSDVRWLIRQRQREDTEMERDRD